MQQGVLGLLTLLAVALPTNTDVVGDFLSPIPVVEIFQKNDQKEEILAEHFLDLNERHNVKSVNQVFSDNILLTLHYLKGDVKDFINDPSKKISQDNIIWEKVREPFETFFVLEPEEIFAFHQNILKEYKDKKIKTFGLEFFAKEGFKAIGGLYGNGVCHLASLMTWVSSEAGLEVSAKVRHNFAPVNGVPAEYGTSIRYQENGGNSQNQNLYIKNTFDKPVTFSFIFQEEKIFLKITK